MLYLLPLFETLPWKGQVRQITPSTNKQTSVVDGLFFSEEGAKVSERERSLCKLGLVNLRQFQAFLSVLLEELIACNNRLAKLDQDLLSESSFCVHF